MNRALRIALTCLLLIALPLQGYAAGGMLFCGAAGGPSAAQHDHVRHAVHDYDGHQHEAAGEADEPDGALKLHDATHTASAACVPPAAASPRFPRLR